ncbi:hypothetical protein QOZ80_3BG0282000 [Eleusine coracana subsp. coracana]|nr:hypothetical protein QOZ80_3BG0282000 [Eleusine coracana subsp. coracana]
MQKLAVQIVVALAILLCSYAAASTIRLQLIHADAGRGFTRRELLHRMARRSKARAVRLLSGAASAPVTPGRLFDTVPVAEYLAQFSIGTPPQPVQVEVDTGSDLTWTQCVPCIACFDQALPYFDPNPSSSFGMFSCRSSACQSLPISSCGTENWWGNQTCVYTYSYGDKSVTTGLLFLDTFTFAGAGDRAVAVPDLAFGCGFFNSGKFISNETGIAGFGRGTLSLPSQLKVDNFSYCFTNITGSAPSTVLLGLPANLHSSARGEIQTTPFIQNPADFPTFYYLSLKAITVGSCRLPVPESAFAFNKNGTGGTIIDSGTAFTMLPPNIYRHLHDTFVSQVKLPVANDDPLCFAVAPGEKPPYVPKLALHFEGATLDLPWENYVFDYEEAGHSYICLAIVEGGDDIAILGNFQQQNMHVLYDLAANKLSFVPAHCETV